MKLILDNDWVRSPIPMGTKILDAFYRKVDFTQDWKSFIVAHLNTVVEEGGVLLQHDQDPKNIREEHHAGGLIGYQFALLLHHHFACLMAK